MTKNQKLYKKELSKIKARQRKLMQEGYFLQDISLPKTPKRITNKAIQQLKKFNIKYLRRRSEKNFQGDLLRGDIAFEKERKDKKKYYNKEQEIRKQLSIFELELKSFGPGLSGAFLAWYHHMLAEYGEERFVTALLKMPSRITDYFEAYRPDYGKAMEMFEEDLKKYLPSETGAYDHLKDIDEETGYSAWEESDIDY